VDNEHYLIMINDENCSSLLVPFVRIVTFWFSVLTGYDDLNQSHDFGKSGYHTSVSPSQSKSNAGL